MVKKYSGQPIPSRLSSNVTMAGLAMVLGALFVPAQAQETSPRGGNIPTQSSSATRTPEENSTRNWRDVFTPIEDPLFTRPPELDRNLQWQLPPELANGSATGSADQAVDFAVSSYSCTNTATAADLNNPGRALKLLQESQPATVPPTLDLPLAVQLAMCHNPQVRASWSAIAQQAANLGQARSAYLPTLSASGNHQNGTLSYPGSKTKDQSINRYGGNAGLRWRLFDFGARGARMDSARHQLQAALHSQNATVNKALMSVLQSYFDAQSAYYRWQSQQNIMPLVQRSLESAQRRQANGAGSRNDTMQAVSAKARAELELSRSKGEYDKAISNLTFTLGLPPGTAFQLAQLKYDSEADANQRTGQNNDKPSSDIGKTQARHDDWRKRQERTNTLMQKALQEWLDQAEERHPAIAAAKAQWLAAQASVKAAQADGMPTIDAGYYYMRNGSPDQSAYSYQTAQKILALTLNVPIFDGFNTTYKVRAAQALAEQKGIEYQATQQQTLQELVQTHAEAQAAWNNLSAANSLFMATREASQSTQRQYDKGIADVMQLNQAFNSLQQAQIEQSKAQSEWTRARLKLWATEAMLK